VRERQWDRAAKTLDEADKRFGVNATLRLARARLFVVRDGQIFEPEMVSGLTGITRSTIIELARDLGYAVTAKPMTRDDVYLADEAFFTGTAAEVTPIREYDNRPIGNGARGPVTTRLQSLFFDTVNGRNAARSRWLFRV